MKQVLSGSGYGLHVGLRGTPDTLETVRPLLPFWWRDDPAPPDEVFDLDGEVPPDSVVRSMEHWVAEHAVDRVFIHAAVVAVDGRALLLPGSSYAGKTTLCVELLRRGATYLSDEYGVLDAAGMVHPYPRVLRVRDGAERVQRTAASFGAVTAAGSLPVAAVALLTHHADATFSVRELSPSAGVLGVMTHAVAARSHSEQVLAAVTTAVAPATCMTGSRGPAADAAEPLLSVIRGAGVRDW